MVVEKEGISIGDLEPGPWRRFKSQTMWLPILRFEDGYGFTYGARMLDVRGPGSLPRAGQTYNQSQVRVVDQAEAVGHAVRATYMTFVDQPGLYVKVVNDFLSR